MYDAIIVGGGIVGSALAYHLVRHNVKTLLIDRHDAGRATDAGAGILAPETSSNPDEAWFEFAVKATAYYPTLIEQLTVAQDGETGYAPCGKLTVAVSEEELVDFEATKRLMLTRQNRRGRPSTDDLHPVSAAEAQALFPPLADVEQAIYYRQAARVDGKLLTEAMQRAAVAEGVEIKQANVKRLLLKKRRVIGVEAEGERFQAGQVAIAGGAWSPDLGAQVGLQIPVEPQRGQILHLHLPNTDTAEWPIISSRNGHYIVCWPNGHIVLGATRETGSGFAPHTTVAGVYNLLSEALWVAPGLAQATIREVRVGLRPLTPDLSPVLGLAPGTDNLYLATGHGPTGLQLGPYTGKLTAALMAGQPLDTDISAFDVRRFL